MKVSKELNAVGATNDVTDDDSDSMGYSESTGDYGTFPDDTNHVINSATSSDVRPMSERLRFIKTICMLGIYLGLVSLSHI